MGVTRGYRGVTRITEGYKGLQVVTGCYKRYRWLQGVTGGDRG